MLSVSSQHIQYLSKRAQLQNMEFYAIRHEHFVPGVADAFLAQLGAAGEIFIYASKNK